MCMNRSRAVKIPRRRSASARAGPTPERYVTAVSSEGPADRPARGPRDPPPRCAVTGASPLEEFRREPRGVERAQIRGPLAHADELHGDVERFVDGDDHAALR